MPVNSQKKIEVRDAAIYASRPIATTRAVGIILYSDGNYGDLLYGLSGRSLTYKKRFIVQEHHNLLGAALAKMNLEKKTPQTHHKAFLDAEVNIFNSASRECDYWYKFGITPTSMYIYIVGPKDMCPSCKNIKRKFSQAYGIVQTEIESDFLKAQY